jgi:hypothetical protein
MRDGALVFAKAIESGEVEDVNQSPVNESGEVEDVW